MSKTANDNGNICAALFIEMTEEEAARAAIGRKVEQDRQAAVALTHTVGAKYQSGRDVAATAKLVRREIADACKSESGPLSGCVCRVTSRRASMMVAIDVVIVSVPERGAPIVNPRWIEAEDSGVQVSPRPSILSGRGTAMLDAAKAIVMAYNFDKSDSVTDYSNVGFYTDSRFDSDLTASDRAEVRRAIALLA